MKKILSLVFVLVFILSSFCINATAKTDDENIIYFEDGSYIVISEITETTISRASNAKGGTKSYTHYNSDGEALWKATLDAQFTYTGSSATCTSSKITYTVYNSSWKITEATATKSSNKATGNVTAKMYILGIPFKTVEKAITITCSASGTLS